MRIALDSSVLIAAHISRAGVCAELLEDLLLHHELVISDFILEELGRKLVEKFSFPRRDAARSALSFVAIVSSHSPPICRRTYAGILPTYRCWALRLPVHARY